jgi:hypothetical protein
MSNLLWRGSKAAHLSDPVVHAAGPVTVGVYGGNAEAGANKNEDGALVWAGANWVFAVLLDAHHSAESADAVLDLVDESKARLIELFDRSEAADFADIQAALVTMLTAKPNVERLGGVKGETACLICFQRGQYLLWLSFGDNQLYLLHPELERLGQYTLNARNYFEWVGERSSAALDVPCFSTGVRELRQGDNIIALVTDGLLEFRDSPFEDPAGFAAAIRAEDAVAASVASMLRAAHDGRTTDSATMIVWQANNPVAGLMPSG